jgi:hypothetical protein
MALQLTAENVENLFEACLRDTGEQFEGIIHKAFLDTSGKEEQIDELLAQLPDEFQSWGGGGYSFLNLCLTKTGELWTGFQLTMEKLCLLGIAAGKARWSLDRTFWHVLPGGMPYFVVLDSQQPG